MTTNIMNEPILYEQTDADIISDYNKYKDKKKVAAIWEITVKEVTDILKRIKD